MRSVPNDTALAITKAAARPTTGQRAAGGTGWSAKENGPYHRQPSPVQAIQMTPMLTARNVVSAGPNQLVGICLLKARNAVNQTHGASATTGGITATPSRSRRSQRRCVRAAAAVHAADQSRHDATTNTKKRKWPIRGPPAGKSEY